MEDTDTAKRAPEKLTSLPAQREALAIDALRQIFKGAEPNPRMVAGQALLEIDSLR